MTNITALPGTDWAKPDGIVRERPAKVASTRTRSSPGPAPPNASIETGSPSSRSDDAAMIRPIVRVIARTIRASANSAASSEVPGSVSSRSITRVPADTSSEKPGGSTSVRKGCSTAGSSSRVTLRSSSPSPSRLEMNSSATIPPSSSTRVKTASAFEGSPPPPPMTTPKKTAMTIGRTNSHIRAARSESVRRRSLRAMANITPP